MEKFFLFSNIILWVVVLIQASFLFILSKLIVNFLNRFRISGKKAETISLKVSDKAPLFRELDHKGNVVRLAENKMKMTMLVFTSGSCNICHDIIQGIEHIRDSFDLRIMLFTKDSLTSYKHYEMVDVHFIKSESLFEDYYIQSVPTIFLVDNNGYITAVEAVNSYKQLQVYLQHYFQNAS